MILGWHLGCMYRAVGALPIIYIIYVDRQNVDRVIPLRAVRSGPESGEGHEPDLNPNSDAHQLHAWELARRKRQLNQWENDIT